MNEEEKTEFNAWLQDDANQHEFEHMQQIWHLSAQKEEQLFDDDKGWLNIEKRITGDPGNIQFTRKKLFISAMRIAASLLFLMTLAFAARYFVGGNKLIKVSASEKMVASPVVLPDNTKVYLNAGSTIIYPKSFSKKSREIELKGEAFFDVARNEKLPFIIHTSNAQIKVLGTSFNVYAYHASDSVQVIVKTGVVELSDNNKTASIQLTKGTTGVYYNTSKQTKFTQADINSLAWFSNAIVFKNAKISYVVKTLEHAFGKHIEIGTDKILNCPLNANFKDQDIEKILETFKTSLNIDFKKTSDGYILTGPGC
jgi:ferric-dicitrate binding protein FerR (iron transport regulator)